MIGKIAIVTALVGGMAYSVIHLDAKNTLNRRLSSKIEVIADVDSNGLSINEMVRVYENLGIDATSRLKSSGFHLRTIDMQQYLKNVGKFDSTTDIYKFSDGF